MIELLYCPICERSLPGNAADTSAAFPFCSERCRQVDFFRWCDGKYAIVEPLDPHRMAEKLDAELESLDVEELSESAEPI